MLTGVDQDFGEMFAEFSGNWRAFDKLRACADDGGDGGQVCSFQLYSTPAGLHGVSHFMTQDIILS